MSLILIEGVDGTGKSTLAGQLSSAIEVPVINIFDGEDKDFLELIGVEVESYHEDIYFLDSWFRLGKPSCVLDRGILSGLAYSNDKPEEMRAWTALGYWLGRMKECQEDVRFLFLDANNETVTNRDNEWEGREGELGVLRDKFKNHHNLLNGYGFETAWIDTSDKKSEEVLELVCNLRLQK